MEGAAAVEEPRASAAVKTEVAAHLNAAQNREARHSGSQENANDEPSGGGGRGGKPNSFLALIPC